MFSRKESMRKAKLSLIASIAIGLLAISTAGVSTYAWLNASSNGMMTAKSGNSTTITISSSEQFDYRYYYFNDNGANGYKTASTSYANFDAAFSEYSETSASYSSVSNLWPGYKMSFCIKLTTSSAFSLTINDSDVTKGTIGGGKHRYLYNSGTTTTEIDLARAMRIYADKTTSNSKVTFDNFLSGKDTSSVDLANKYEYSKYADGAFALSTATSTLVSQVAASETTYYIYYTVEFSNSSETYYQEVNGSDGKPVSVPGTGSIRYFKFVHDSTGNSNVYKGLAFNINTMNIS